MRQGFALELERSSRSWDCEGCGLTFVGLAVPDQRLCLECRARQDGATAAPPAPAVPELLERAGVPWRFRQGWTSDRWEQEFGAWPAEDLAHWQPRSERSMLLLIGSSGHGKTGLATVLLEAAITGGRTVRWVRAEDLVDRLRTAISAEESRHRRAQAFAVEALELMFACRRADVLLLDDLFASKRHTPYAIERILELVACRYDDGLQTIVTTNRDEEQLRAINESLGSRLLSGVVIYLERDRGDRRGE